jgi:predicted nucleic acid-binding protein
VIVDTNFIIRLARRDPDAERLLQQIRAGGEPLVLPTPVIYELETGFSYTGNEQARERFLDVTRDYSIRDFDVMRAERAGRIAANLMREGVDAGDVDIMVSSFALPHRDSIASNDPDFEAIVRAAGVPLRRWVLEGDA